MRGDETRNVSLTAEMNNFIRDQVACGRYQNASEVVRSALRLLQDRQQSGDRHQMSAAKSDANHGR